MKTLFAGFIFGMIFSRIFLANFGNVSLPTGDYRKLKERTSFADQNGRMLELEKGSVVRLVRELENTSVSIRVFAFSSTLRKADPVTNPNDDVIWRVAKTKIE